MALYNPMGCSLPGSSVHGILQARILEWVAIPFSRESSRPRDGTQISCIGRQILYLLSHQGSPLYYTTNDKYLALENLHTTAGVFTCYILVGFKTVLGCLYPNTQPPIPWYMASLGREKHQEGLWKLGNLQVGEEMREEME